MPPAFVRFIMNVFLAGSRFIHTHNREPNIICFLLLFLKNTRVQFEREKYRIADYQRKKRKEGSRSAAAEHMVGYLLIKPGKLTT